MHRISQSAAKNVTPIPQLFLTNHSENLVIKDEFRKTTTPQNYADLMGLEKRIRTQIDTKGGVTND